MTPSRAPYLLLLAVALALPAASRAEEAAAPATPATPAADAAKPIESENEAESEGEGRARARTLEDRIRPVSGHLFVKDRRVELSPGLGISLGDAFFQKYSAGLKLAYHLSETFSLGAHLSYSLNRPSGAISVSRGDKVVSPELGDLKDVPGKIGLLTGLDVGWTPIYGKLNVLAEKVLHFDFGVVGGVSAIQYQAPAGKDTFTVGAHLGIGQRYFLTPNMTLRIELRDYVYSAKIVTLGSTSSKIENQLMLEVGLSFLLGQPPRD